MTYTAPISSKGQIVLPKPIRDRLNLKTADRLNISLEAGSIIVRPIAQTETVFGMFEPKGKINLQEMTAAIRNARGKKFNP